MRKTHLTLPLIAAAALSLAACAKQDSAQNNTAASDLTLNDEDAVSETNFTAGDALDANASSLDNGTLDNAAAENGSDGAGNTQ